MKSDINTKTITAEEFDRMFDDGKNDVLHYFDTENAIRIGDIQQKVSMVLPGWMVLSIDREADRLGITRQAVIKVWLDEKLKSQAAASA